MDYQLDLREYRCPLPLLMTKKALKALPKKATLSVFLSRDTSLADFELLGYQEGYTVTFHHQGKMIALVFE